MTYFWMCFGLIFLFGKRDRLDVEVIGETWLLFLSWFVSICLRMGIMEIASSHFLVLHINWSHKSCFAPFPATLAFPVSLGSCSNSGDLLDIQFLWTTSVSFLSWSSWNLTWCWKWPWGNMSFLETEYDAFLTVLRIYAIAVMYRIGLSILTW